VTPPLVIAAELPGARGGVATAASVAVSLAARANAESRSVLMVEARAERGRGPTMLAAEAARRLEHSLGQAGIRAAARGRLCWLCLDPESDVLGELTIALGAAVDACAAVAHLPGGLWSAALGRADLGVTAGILRADLPRQRSLTALAVRELRDAGVRARVASRAPGPVAARRVASGLEPGGHASVRAGRLARGLLRD
jgi:hypothetical protein